MTDFFDNCQNFREEARVRGLAFRRAPEDKPICFLDLNQGQLYTPCDPQKILELVRLARRFADSEEYGEHNAILDLVVRRREIGNMEYSCYWARPYHVRIDNSWVSISEWLAENGYEYIPQG